MSVALGSAYGEIRIGTGDAERNVASLADSMRNVGTRMSLAISAPLAIIGKTGLQAAGNFEQSMNVVQVVTGATAEAMAAMQAKALQLGKDTSFSANEAAEGMLELAKAGMTAEQTIASIGGVLDLAAAGSLSVAQAAEITANALNAFQLPAEDAARVADLLAAAANSSSIEVTDMAQAFQMSSAVFASNKQSIDDLATAIAILGNNGLKGSDAGTSLKTMMMRLAAPTDDAAGAMRNLGLYSGLTTNEFEALQEKISKTEEKIADLDPTSRTYGKRLAELTQELNEQRSALVAGNSAFYDAQGNMVGMGEIIRSLEAATADLTDEQRNAAYATIFGSDAIRAANILVDAGAESWDAMSASVNEAGAAQKVAEARMKGLNGAIDYIKGTIESTLVSAFLPLTDALGGMIRWVADLIAKFAELPKPVINAALAFAAVLAAAGPILVALPAIGAVLAALLSPIGLIVVAVAGLAAAWAGNLGGIQEKTAAVIAALQPAFDRLKQYLDMIKGGDWGGLTKAVFGDVNSMLQKAAATISAFDWSAWIAGVLQWADYITAIAWDAFIAALAWTSDIVGSVDWAAFITTLGAWKDYIETLSWAAFVATLAWGAEYIQSLDWAAFVATLSDWGQWISSLDWTKIITTVIDWATWIPALTWNTFFTVVDWSTYIVAFVWSEFISKIDWGAWISGMLTWGDHVSEFDWGEWVSGALDWSAYIMAFTWDSFVSKLEWPIIAEFAWNEWIVDFEWPTLPSFSWGSWINSFRWPTVTWPGWSTWISSFTWPSLPAFNWGDWISSFSWPSFPSIPSDWWKFGLGGGAGNNAMGTHFWEGGLTWVGERGPELIDLPRGARVYDATSSAQMTAGAGVTIENHYHVYNDLDVEVVARQVMDTMRRYAR